MAVGEWCGRIKEVGEVELAVGEVSSFIAAEVNVDCCCILVWINVVVSIDGVEEDEGMRSAVRSHAETVLLANSPSDSNRIDTYTFPDILSSTKNIVGSSGSQIIESAIGAFMSLTSR